jgi:magnesium transporter
LVHSLIDRLGPQEASIGHIVEFQHLFLSPLFVVYASLLILTSFVIIFYYGPKSVFTRLFTPHHADSLFPRYGSKNMIWYLLVCSLIGGLSVSVTTGLGAAIVTSITGENQVRFFLSAHQCATVPDMMVLVQILVHLLSLDIYRGDIG